MPSFLRASLPATVTALAVAATPLSAALAACTPGAATCPIVVQMARGADTITLRNTLVQNADCCAYSLSVRAGQVMTWSETGATIRTTIRYPNGDMDGPGLPQSIPLPQGGVYIFSVRPNLMADGAFGPFVLTVTIR